MRAGYRACYNSKTSGSPIRYAIRAYIRASYAIVAGEDKVWYMMQPGGTGSVIWAMHIGQVYCLYMKGCYWGNI